MTDQTKTLTLKQKLRKAGFGGLAIITLLPIIREHAAQVARGVERPWDGLENRGLLIKALLEMQ